MKKNHTKFKTQNQLLMSYFQQHPDQDISHPQIVDWAVPEWKKQTGKKFRDPTRQIRKLHEQGRLIKVNKGVYRYDPQQDQIKKPMNFNSSQKQKIFQRDQYKCVICGQGKKEGLELHVDHIKPQARGGNAQLKNGQTLCSQHNVLKKKLKQTEVGKKMFIRLYNLSTENKNLRKFCIDILKTYERHNIDRHIEWNR